MSGSTVSPNTGNIQVGKGFLEFKEHGQSEWRHMGNCSEIVGTPEVETLEHFSSMQGTKKKDLVIILEQKYSIKITMEEITPANVALATGGTLDEAADGGPEVEIFGATSKSGELKFTGTNDQGPKIDGYWPNVSFTPSGDFGFISEEFNSMEITGDVLAGNADQGAYEGKFGILKWTDIQVGS
jgi:hypothetical protein